jgi:hypothetical protein
MRLILHNDQGGSLEIGDIVEVKVCPKHIEYKQRGRGTEFRYYKTKTEHITHVEVLNK